MLYLFLVCFLVVVPSALAQTQATIGSAPLPQAAADGTTKGVATFAPNDFNCTDGLCSIDYTNGLAASDTTKGFLTSGDWQAFNAKQNALGFTPENVANKSTVATLGTSNTTYSTHRRGKRVRRQRRQGNDQHGPHAPAVYRPMPSRSR